MAGKYVETTGQWHFNSVQDFWDAEDLEGRVWKGRFEGKLQKGLVDDGRLRDFRREDLEQGLEPDTLILLHVINHERANNHDCQQLPPPRTGLFSAFIDEVEEVAIQAECRSVLVDKVFNKFLRKKLKKRGYRKVPRHDRFPNPDYVKVLLRR